MQDILQEDGTHLRWYPSSTMYIIGTFNSVESCACFLGLACLI